MYGLNWELTRERFIGLWEGKMVDRPVMIVTAPKKAAGCPEVEAFKDTEKYLTDPAYRYWIQSAEDTICSTYRGGDALPIARVPFLHAFLAREAEFCGGTMWVEPWIEDWNDVPEPLFDPANRWWQYAKEILAAYAKAAHGRYLVGLTTFCASMDSLMFVRSQERLCTDLIDHPEKIRAVCEYLDEVLKKIYVEAEDIICSACNQEGMINWFGIWAPGRMFMLQCDFSCMISREMFDEFVLPSIASWVEWLDYSVYHLDGPGAVRHLDSLLTLDRLKGIQWEAGAGAPPSIEWIPLLKKIQDAGKFVAIEVKGKDVGRALWELDPKRLYLHVKCESEQEAKELLRLYGP